MRTLSAVGLMSGSSLDGIDLALCRFSFENNNLQGHQILKAATIPYTSLWEERLATAPHLSGKDLWQLHTDLGHLYAQEIALFLEDVSVAVDLIASHGHTVFHFPDQGSTTQIGDGAAMAARLEMIVIDQFRSLDMALGGQGAPLAPLIDQMLFADYFACLNLGGIANLSIQLNNKYIAFDNGGANQVFNALCQEIGLAYDDRGQLAASGECLPSLLECVNQLDFFQQAPPKSLGNDWVKEKLIPLYQNKEASLNDRLHTACVQLAQQIGQDLKRVAQQENRTLKANDKMLVSGGGAFNDFLCAQIAQAIAPVQLVLAEDDMIAYKEAVLMALAGVLRFMEQPNVLPTVTGASRAAIGGAIHYGKRT